MRRIGMEKTDTGLSGYPSNTFFLKKDKPLLGLRGHGVEPHTVLRKE